MGFYEEVLRMSIKEHFYYLNIVNFQKFRGDGKQGSEKEVRTGHIQLSPKE